jgi:tetratricopeptide (TPR) repeat protein
MNITGRWIVRILLLFCPLQALAQPKTGKALADSLLQVIPHMANDTNKVNALVKLSKALYTTSPEQGVKYGQQALQLAEEKKWIKGQGAANIAIGANYEQRSDLTKALANYFAGLKLYEQLKDKKGIASAFWGLGNIYNVQKNFVKSLDYQFKALATYRELGDKRAESSLLGNIANNYLMSGNYDKALEYYMQSLPMKEKIGEPIAIAVELHNVGSVYFKKENYLSALVYYDKVRKTVKPDDAPGIYARSLGNIGACYLKIVMDSLNIENDSLVPPTKEGVLNMAIDYIQQSIKLGSQTGDIEQLYNSYNDLAEAMAYKKDYQAAYNYLIKKYDYRDSVFSTDKSSIISRLEAQRAADEVTLKEKDMQILKLRSQVYIISIILLVFIIAIGVVRIARQREANRELSQEKERHLERIDSQNKILEHIAHIQSHDLRASVSNILGLAKLFNEEEPTDPHNAEIIHGILQVASKMDKDIIDVVNKENQLRKGNN